MKDKIKGLIAGILVGAILASGVTFAAGTTTLYNVVTNGIKIVIDGKRINPTDANGKKVEPIIYNGTTYLPVRAIATALGKEVYWDGPNYTVYLGNMDGKLQYPSVEMEDMVSIGDHTRSANASCLRDNYGNTYDRAVWNGSDGRAYEYLLNMKYSRFKGTFYVVEGETSPESTRMRIIADGKTIYTSPQMTKASAPVNIDVNITGCNHLEIELEYAGYNELETCIADAGFYQ